MLRFREPVKRDQTSGPERRKGNRVTTPDEHKAGRGRGGHDVLICAMLLAGVSVVFGGASRDNHWRLTSVELAALPLAFVAVQNLVWRDYSLPLLVLGAVLMVPLTQLIPLPPQLWTRLPGAGPRIEALTLSGVALGWRPISLAPIETWRAFLALIPPAAMVLGAIQLRHRQVRAVAGLYLALGFTGLVLGAGQLAGGAGSAFYPYAYTNYDTLVGWFANRNHEAASLLAVLPLAAALIGPSDGNRQVGVNIAAILFMFLAVVGLGAVKSRTGIFLAVPTLIASLILLWRRLGAQARWRILTGAGLAVVAGVGVIFLFGLAPIVARFVQPAASEGRFFAWPIALHEAIAHLPFGSGLGSFDRVFRAAEPLTLVGPIYFNHAHNDYLELGLEAGGLAAIAMVFFAVWFAGSALRAWRMPRQPGSSLAQAASLCVMVLLAFSTGDYPLRTESLTVVFAFACGILAHREPRHQV